VRCHPPRLSQLSIRPRAIETDELVVKTIAEKTHGATPRWLHVVSGRSMLDPCGVMVGFGDMSSENKYAALAAALGKGESAGKICEHELRESGVGESGSAEGISIETPMQSQMSDGSGAPPEAHAAPLGRGHLWHQLFVVNVLRVGGIGESEQAESGKEDVQMPSQLVNGCEAQPF
jgi:hypothetical protein